MTKPSGLTSAVLAALLAGLSATASAQDAAKLFAKPAEYREASLSPNGAYVAVTTPFEDRRALSVIKLSGNYDRSVIKFEDREQPFGVVWTDDQRVLVEKAKDFGLFGNLLSTGDVYAANADGTEQVQLFGYLPDRGNVRSRFKDEGTAYFIKNLPDTKGEALFYYVPWTTGNSKFTTTVFRVDTYKGARTQLETFPDRVGVDADNAGNLRFNTRWDLDARQIVQYRAAPGSEWTTAPATLAGRSLNVWYFDRDNNHAYAEISDRGEPASLYRVDLAAGTREKLSSHPTLEISNAERAGRFGPPVVLTYTQGKPKVDYLDPKSEWAQLHAGLMKAFPGQMVSFVNLTKDEQKLLFFVYSDRHPGAYYLFDRQTKQPTLLFETMSWIDPAKMAPMMPIEFKNRGGDTIYGFLTLPGGRTGPHPLVVMPHGGPFHVSDSWGFDPDAQFLASLGYAVLQVNYRGSSGRGDTFETSTYRQWGEGIQDDITDAVKHVIAQKWANPDKVCIFGISFGGYSAMMNPIRNPGMYKCAIGYAGVYDLAKMQEADDSSKQLRSWFLREVANDPAQVIAQSPITHIAKFDVPMLLIHGKSDTTAPFEQYSAAQAALSHAGKVYESLVKPGEGHGFYKEENRAEAYARIRDFLLKYNPPN